MTRPGKDATASRPSSWSSIPPAFSGSAPRTSIARSAGPGDEPAARLCRFDITVA
jgi:hypothetical protein